MHGFIRVMLFGYALCSAMLTISDSAAAESSNREQVVMKNLQEGGPELIDTAGQQSVTQKGFVVEKAFTDPITGMNFVLVEGGCFQMGNTLGGGDNLGSILPAKLFWYFNMGGTGSNVDIDEKPVHEVCVDSFYLGKYEVTQKEYQEIVGNNPSAFPGDLSPVEQVSWNDTQVFITKLANRSGLHYRLPTEAEWEYAARSGGKQEKYAGGDDIGSLAWYDQKFESPHTVGKKLPNGLGLFDMSGNVWEWCQDWYDKDYYSQSPKSNPIGPESGSYRVVRGGSFDNYPRLARTANRLSVVPDTRKNSIGFRLALSIQEAKISQGAK
ncbi:MAG: formylglycine-generating enzyme family protein [Proteobacteria bacterium]|nr:formylglycine-generating enzyme family protein [Pseudomonadota bacterium]